MAEDWEDKVMAALLAIIFLIALGPWAANRLWQFEIVRELVFNILFFIAVVAVIGLILLIRDPWGR